MVVFEVIGQLWQLFVRAFMIAAERNRWTSLGPKRGLTLYSSDEIVLGMAKRDEERWVLGPAEVRLVQPKEMK